MVTMSKLAWLAGAAVAALVCGCAGVPRSQPATTTAPPYYPEALRAYWNESNSTAFVLASLAVEKDPDLHHAEQAAYLASVLVTEKLSGSELKEAVTDPRISHLMLDIYARGLRAAKTNDYALAFRAFRDFTLCTPSEAWRRVSLTALSSPGMGHPNSPGEIDQNLLLAEVALKLAVDPVVAGQLAETAGTRTPAQHARAAQVLEATFEHTGDLAWGEKAFARWLDAQQPGVADKLAGRLLASESATANTYVSITAGYMRTGRLTRAEEILRAANNRFRNGCAEVTSARAELYWREHRYDDALNELLIAGRENPQFRREHYHPVWAKPVEAVGLATGPDDSVYAITGETKPRVLHFNRDGDLMAQYGPFDDPTEDGVHPFAAFNDGSFLIRNRRWSPDGQMLRELPLSPGVRAVSIDSDQRVLAWGRSDGIKIFGSDGQLVTHLCGDGPPSYVCNSCPCAAIAAGLERIILVTWNGVNQLDYRGNFFGPGEAGRFHDLAAGRDGIFYLTSDSQVKVVRVAPYSWQSLESIPCGGLAVAGATSGGFYVAGVTTERGTWLVKFAPPVAPRD